MPSALDRYPHQRQSIALAGRSFDLWVPSNPDQIFLDMRPEDFGREEKLPHWARLWPGAFALGEYLLHTGIAPGTRVLDLGCGLALNGIIAAQLGADVLATDWFPEALDFAQANAALNGTAIRTAFMDWNAPPPDLRVDLLLGADLLYERRNHAPILACIRKIVVRGGEAWLSDPGRPHVPAFLEDLKREDWEYEALKVGGVNVWRLRC